MRSAVRYNASMEFEWTRFGGHAIRQSNVIGIRLKEGLTARLLSLVSNHREMKTIVLHCMYASMLSLAIHSDDICIKSTALSGP